MLTVLVVPPIVRSFAALAVILATAPIASAQPGAAPPTPGTPAAPPSDDHQTANIATNPFAWAIGLYGLGVSVALRRQIALHADTNYLDDVAGSNHVKGYELGLGVTVYPRHAFSGLLIEPGVRFRRVFEHCKGCGDFDGDDINTRTTTAGPELLVGWHWMIDGNFNVAVAIGLMYNVYYHPTLFTAAGKPLDSAFEPDGYVRIGIAF